MAATAVNPDLSREREKATFDVDQLTCFLYDGPANTRRKRYIQDVVLRDFAKHNFRPIATLSHEGQYEQALQRSALAVDLEESVELKGSKELIYFREAMCPQSTLPHALHIVFVDVINRQASDEQRKKWLPMARSHRMIGTYVQTEIGHGTYLRGLETTATYDPATQEFVIHSPTISSIKFWSGGLGKTANCCILMAHLVTKGVNHGMHPFLLQIRDFDTHQPLPGITVGDIGAKLGFNTVDSGFLRMDHVRIPRTNLLMRYTQVLEDGTYVKPTDARLTFSTMTLVRAEIVGISARALAMATTITVRYSAVRRQTEMEPGGGEVQVLDFQTQQMKLLPLVAAAYALTCTYRNVTQLYTKVMDSIDKTGASPDLPTLHALSSGLKALSSWEAVAGVEQCRTACGGHGFGHFSGIPKIYSTVAAYVTTEGENTVLMLPLARYLMKCCRSARQGEALPSKMSYLAQSPAVSSKLGSGLRLSDLVDLYQHRAARLSHGVTNKFESALGQGQPSYKTWNANSVQLVNAALAHCKSYVVKSMADTVPTLTGRLREVMEKLCQLYAVTGILSSLGDFLEDGYLSSSQSSMLRDRLCDLLADLRPNAVALVDAFDFPDAILDSALGRWDGNVYDALYQWSLHSAMNEKQVLDAYYKYQRPFMEAHWAKNPQMATARL